MVKIKKAFLCDKHHKCVKCTMVIILKENYLLSDLHILLEIKIKL